MKKNLLLPAVLLLTANCLLQTFSFAQTSIPGGNVSGTWNLAGSPYQIQGAIQIPDGQTLTIDPGVTVDFQGTYKLLVMGRLLAIGTVTDTIIFTAVNFTNGWRGIRFDNTPATNDTSKIKYCKLQYGKATGTSPDDDGGAIYFNNFSKAIISMCRIANCMANSSGGGINCKGSSPTITNNTISNNTAGGGGGGINCQSSNPAITNNTISRNTATLGSGICCQSSSPIITNNTISNNTATSPTFGGGGIYCTASSNPTITNNTISNNTASSGGGIYCGFGSPPDITNNTISNNSATNGGALYCADNSDPTLRNTIVWGNTATASGAQVFLFDEPSDPRFYYCNVQGGTLAFGLNGNIYTGTYQNNIDIDPKFVSPSGGSGTGFNGVTANWSLQNTSPCIDTGDPATLTPATDKAGNPRVTVCRIDMGAYEFQNGIPLSATITQTPPLCFGNSNGTATVTASGGTAPYTYLWSNGQSTSTATGLSATIYTVTVTESLGCTKIYTVSISQPAVLTANISVQSNDVCGIGGVANVTVTGGTSPYTFLWSNGNTTTSSSGLLAGNYLVTVTDNKGCTKTATTTIAPILPASIPICLVTVDSISQYNIIVWEKPVNAPIDSFIIYREISLNNYQPIGAVAYDSLSWFMDTVRIKYFPNTGNPNSGTYRYKIQVRDTCGNYSALSPYHNTIYMTNNNGTFSWLDLYTIEGSSNPVNSYELWRDDNNTGTGWHAVNSVSGTQKTVTDVAYAAWAATANWRIQTNWNISCTPSIKNPVPMGTTINNSKSNNMRPTAPTSVNEIVLENSVNIFPNPFAETATLQITNGNELRITNLKLFDVLGQEQRVEFICNSAGFVIRRSNLVAGIYFLKIIADKGVVNKKIAIK